MYSIKYIFSQKFLIEWYLYTIICSRISMGDRFHFSRTIQNLRILYFIMIYKFGKYKDIVFQTIKKNIAELIKSFPVNNKDNNISI